MGFHEDHTGQGARRSILEETVERMDERRHALERPERQERDARVVVADRYSGRAEAIDDRLGAEDPHRRPRGVVLASLGLRGQKVLAGWGGGGAQARAATIRERETGRQ